MKTQCPSCRAQCWFSDEAVVHRTRCKTCGTTIIIDATPSPGTVLAPDAVSLVPVVMSLSRSDARTGTERTLLLREDSTTELREGGSREGRVLSMSNTTKQTTKAWSELGGTEIARFRDVARSGAEGCDYVLEVGETKLAFRGVPTDPAASAVWRMLTGLWSTVESSPL